MTTFAVCANPLADLQIVTARTATNSFVAKTATASCPSDTRLTGTGYRIDGTPGAVRVENLQPGTNVSPTNVSVQANEDDDGTTRNWALTAYRDLRHTLTRRNPGAPPRRANRSAKPDQS